MGEVTATLPVAVVGKHSAMTEHFAAALPNLETALGDAYAEPALAEAWHDEDASTSLLRGIAFSLIVGPAIWLALAAFAFVVFELVRG